MPFAEAIALLSLRVWSRSVFCLLSGAKDYTPVYSFFIKESLWYRIVY